MELHLSSPHGLRCFSKAGDQIIYVDMNDKDGTSNDTVLGRFHGRHRRHWRHRLCSDRRHGTDRPNRRAGDSPFLVVL